MVGGQDGIIGKDYFGIKKKIAVTYDTFSMFSVEADAEIVKLPSEGEKLNEAV